MRNVRLLHLFPSSLRGLLERIHEEYITRNRKIEVRKNIEIKRLSRNIQDLKEELDRIAQMKTGTFGSFSKRAKEQKETEITKNPNFAQGELQLALRIFTPEQQELQDKYEKRKQAFIEQIQNLQKEIENLEVDNSLEVRRATCEALVNVANALLKRKTSELY